MIIDLKYKNKSDYDVYNSTFHQCDAHKLIELKLLRIKIYKIHKYFSVSKFTKKHLDKLTSEIDKTKELIKNKKYDHENFYYKLCDLNNNLYFLLCDEQIIITNYQGGELINF